MFSFFTKIMSTTSTKIQQQVKIQPRTDVKPPSMFNVIYVNDNVTTVEFVIESLKIIFGHDDTTAEHITSKVHENGSAVAATMPYELAEQKGVEVTLLARNNGFPLAIKLEMDV